MLYKNSVSILQYTQPPFVATTNQFLSSNEIIAFILRFVQNTCTHYVGKHRVFMLKWVVYITD